MLEVKEEAIDAESKVSSYRSGQRPAAWPWIPGNDQPMSPASGAAFSRVTFEHRYTKLQQTVFSQKQIDGSGQEAPLTSLRASGLKLDTCLLFKLNFLISFFFIFAPECVIIAYKFCPVSKICFQGGSA